MATTLFYMWEAHRAQLIASHNFYIRQAEKRLLSQFNNIEEEADEYANEWLDQAGQNFDSDRHDLADFYEQANDEGINFYLMLEEMRNRTRISVIAGIFHEWDKQLRSWLVNEVHHWHRGELAKKAIWKANFVAIVELLEGLGFEIMSLDCYRSLDRCRLVVNAYKHGDGGAFESIKLHHPEFIKRLEMDDIENLRYVDHSDLFVKECHISEFSDAVIAFWKCVPHAIIYDESLIMPTWFTRALEKDRKEDPKEEIQ